MKRSLNNGTAASKGLFRRDWILKALLGLCWLLIGWESTGLAAEWSVVPSLGMKGQYDSNLLLTPFPHQATYGYWISPGAEFSGKTERLEVSGKTALDFVDYYGGQTNRFTNIYLPLSSRYRTEKDEWSFTGGFTRDNTLMGELRTTGVVLQFTQRNLWTANPTWTRNLTEKLAFQGDFQFSDATYENGLQLGLVDYQVFGGSAGLLYHVTERDDIQLSGTYTNFHTTNAPLGLRASFPGAMLSVTHSFTETLKATAYGGPRFISSTTQVGGAGHTNRDTVWVYGAGFTQQFERASLQFTLARDIFPSGFGLLIQTDRVGLLASYNLSETVTASFDISGYIVSGATSLASGGVIPNSRLFYSTPKIVWKFSEWWNLEASYTYRQSNIDGFSNAAVSNVTMLMLTYYPPKLAFSY